jgi:branched-subunit amino acid transport protein
MSAWVVVAVVSAGSYLFRISMLAVAARHTLPAWVERAAGLAVPTAFAALATTSISNAVSVNMASVAPAAAVLAAIFAVRRTGSAQAALVVGMPVMWILSLLIK